MPQRVDYLDLDDLLAEVIPGSLTDLLRADLNVMGLQPGVLELGVTVTQRGYESDAADVLRVCYMPTAAAPAPAPELPNLVMQLGTTGVNTGDYREQRQSVMGLLEQLRELLRAKGYRVLAGRYHHEPVYVRAKLPDWARVQPVVPAQQPVPGQAAP